MPQATLRWFPLDEHQEMLEQYRVARAAARKWSDREKLLAEQLIKLIGDDDGGSVGGASVVRVVRRMSGGVDYERLHTVYPDVWTDCQKEPTPNKPFLQFMS